MIPNLLAAITAQAQSDPLVAVDALLEHGATLTEVLLAFAGNPPDWSDGLPQQALAEWLARQVPADGRVSRIQGYWVQKNGSSWWTVIEEDRTQNWRTEQAARRYLKRRVLALFPEVKRTIMISLPWKPTRPERGEVQVEIPKEIETAGFRNDLPMEISPDYQAASMVFSQTLTAPDWIAPHEEERAKLRELPQT